MLSADTNKQEELMVKGQLKTKQNGIL